MKEFVEKWHNFNSKKSDFCFSRLFQNDSVGKFRNLLPLELHTAMDFFLSVYDFLLENGKVIC